MVDDDPIVISVISGLCIAWLSKSLRHPRTSNPGVSEFLCKRFGLQLTEMRSPNSMVKRVSAAFQSRMGMVHF
ncbi:hypothetical protein PV794_13815, partial [Comamonas aquatica]|nr:hypothetical protein [Comamonas aquatica]